MYGAQRYHREHENSVFNLDLLALDPTLKSKTHTTKDCQIVETVTLSDHVYAKHLHKKPVFCTAY